MKGNNARLDRKQRFFGSSLRARQCHRRKQTEQPYDSQPHNITFDKILCELTERHHCSSVDKRKRRLRKCGGRSFCGDL